MNEEMRIHLEFEIEDRVRRGMTPTEARRTAFVDSGGVEERHAVQALRYGAAHVFLQSLPGRSRAHDQRL